jgi:hypothetical protein
MGCDIYLPHFMNMRAADEYGQVRRSSSTTRGYRVNEDLEFDIFSYVSEANLIFFICDMQRGIN